MVNRGNSIPERKEGLGQMDTLQKQTTRKTRRVPKVMKQDVPFISLNLFCKFMEALQKHWRAFSCVTRRRQENRL